MEHKPDFTKLLLFLALCSRHNLWSVCKASGPLGQARVSTSKSWNWSRWDVKSDGLLLSSNNEFNQYNVSENEFDTIQSEYMIDRLLQRCPTL